MGYSDDDMLDVESGEDNYRYSDDDDVKDSYYDDGIDDDFTSNRSQIGYVVLNEADIHKLQRDDIERVSTILSISQVEAIVLLLHYHWSVGKVEDEWFTDEERVRRLVGIFKEPIVENDHGGEVTIECGICFETYVQKEIATVSCGHPYCITCWTGYIAAKINEGPGCLMVKCPEPSCSAAIGQDLIEKVANEKDKEKYYRFLLRSYIKDNGKKIKWCPSPGCEYVVDFGNGNGSGNYDVSCLCSYSFCWNCSEDAHRPVDCETVSKWIFKNNDESENTNWILANTKPCPECKRSIEKNLGCNHMTCPSPCRHEFCWTCLGAWVDHNCHKYKENDDETEIRRARAKNAIDRYVHYYERWANNQSSRLKAMENLEKLQSVQLKELSDKQSTPETQLQFTIEAWLQVSISTEHLN